jgi:NAD(P)H-dependent FMN reductase
VRDPLRIAVITASVRRDRIGPVVARWFLGELPAHTDAEVDAVDLADLALPDDLGGGGDTGCFTGRLAAADAVVIVTPEYNRGYPGPLKTAVDTAGAEWHAKPVGFVSYGGISGGLRAVEQLRPVLAELHVVTVQASVSLSYAWDLIDGRGELCPPRGAASAAGAMLRQLIWWARTLRTARALEPYP